MGKYLKKFSSFTEYDNFKGGGDWITPNVSLITENGKQMKYTKRVKQQTDYSKEYFTIKALEDGLTASLSVNACEYSLDGNTWNSLSSATNTPTVNTGEKIYFRGNLTPTSSNGGIGTFTVSKKCNVKGNVTSLLYGDDFEEQNDLTSKNYTFYKLFYNCTTIVNASELILPATILLASASGCYSSMFYGCTNLISAPKLPAITLSHACYSSMFYGCTSLVEAPELPATTLGDYCYYRMFYGCTSLINAPKVLPATELANYCYQDMFYGCTSLVEAPELPATELAYECYSYMFYGCTSLVEAPELPATTLGDYCYYRMFYKCSKLNKITMLATNISANYCLHDWVSIVPASGTFIKHPDMNSLPTGDSGIPEGWTVEDYYTITLYKNLSITANNVGWNSTNTIINWSVICEAISYDNQIIEFVLTGKTESDSFEQNTSDSDVIREISFTYMGMTATTTIIQYAYTEDSYSSDYLTFTNTGEDTLIISILDLNSEDAYAHSFSIDNGEWIEGNMEEKVYAIITPNQSVRFKSNFEPFSFESGEEPHLKAFVILSLEENNPSCSVSGNIMSLLYGNDFIGKTDLTGYDGVFYFLFAGNALIGVDSPITDASNLVLPATTLSYACYYLMFAGCTGLTVAPSILPATTLADGCYQSMFEGCTSLVNAPELPATTLASGCYGYMFSECTSLTTAPVLPATTLADDCYYYMFRNCNSLNYIKMLATDISANNCLNNWVIGVSETGTGTFVKHPDMNYLPIGPDGIPEGWTVVDNVEKNLITFTIDGVE